MRIREPEDILAHPLKGAIFETYILSEIYKAFAHRGVTPPLYFGRDRTGHEVDVALDNGKNLVPIEIKSGETLADSFFKGLRFFISLGPPSLPFGVLIHGGDALCQRENFIVRPWYRCV